MEKRAPMPRCRLLLALVWSLLALLVAPPVVAQAARPQPTQISPTHIAAELIAEAPAAPGQTVTLAFRMRPDKGWHGYWANPGDAGFGMTLKWSLPPGATAGSLRYPVPETLLIAGLMNHVYEHDYAVLVPLTLPPGAAPGSHLPVSVEANWLACTDQVCVPERAVLRTVVTVAAARSPAAHDPRFDAWRAKLPAPLGAQAHFALDRDRVRLGIPLPANLPLENPHFFAAGDHVTAYAAPQVFRRKDDLLIVELTRPRLAAASPGEVAGVLRLNAAGDGVEIAAVPGAVPIGGEPVAPTGAAEPEAFPLLLLGALLGGLLLNVMPCVFPILSLKALSLARAGESEAHARTEGLAYGAGVIVACLALGAALLALRAAGNEIGWAFQLQEPGVVAALALLTVAITANLLGMFELAVPGFTQGGSKSGAFATGLLAAFVATPCTGPFMAAAMGAALLLPAPWALALFATLGIGIALPFLAIAFIPALRRQMPRPGPWMVRFRRWMALPMAATSLALLWLASRLGGWSFALGCAGLAAALVALLVVVGRRQHAGKSSRALVLAGTAALALVGAAILPRLVHSPGTEARSLLASEPFSDAALARARAAGKPVFAYFTADWCLTCKVNEQVAIERETTRTAFARAGVVVLKGDWTRRDPAITRYLTAHGAAGVPLYVWYPKRGEGQVLPQVLTPGMLANLQSSRED
jgi:DsbC/DsbD-like thiol-disulfide interchange protein/cytochrome c biogenesis protein CcdA